MEEAQKLCDRVGIIDHGKLLALDSVENLIRAHGGAMAVVAEVDGAEERVTTTDPVAQVGAWLKRGDARNLRIERPDLETVFLSLTGRSLRD
jgi:ABC-2 type transport system ATP-binding protein